MYKEYFHLRTYPFENTPDPLFYYSSPSHREALASMVYGVREGKGFVLISGDVGTGKTMLVQTLKQELGENDLVIEIASPWVSSEEIMSVLRTKLGVRQIKENGEHALMEALKKKLIQFNDDNRRVVLVVDEAHQLPERTLEGIRLLSNIETGERKLIQIILLGQEELVEHLSRYSLRQLNQRIALRFHLGRLPQHEVEDYIRFRLRVAGGSESLFTPESLVLIASESGGVPRLINLICDSALLFAYGQSLNRVDEQVVMSAVERMRPPDVFAKNRGGEDVSVAEPQAGAGDKVWPAPPIDLPFSTQMPPKPVPAAEPKKQEFPYLPREAPARSSNNLWRMGVLGLLLILIIWVLFVWWPTRSVSDSDNVTTQEAPHSVAEQAPPVDGAVGGQPKGEIEAAIPVPFSSGSGASKEFRTRQSGDIKTAASNQYGIWNETIEDIILTTNPALSGIDNQPSGIIIKFPLLSREQMIVQGKNGEYYIYYASFKDMAHATDAVRALKEVWHKSFVSPVTVKGNVVYRVFIGALPSRDMSESVVRSLWFKYLPELK